MSNSKNNRKTNSLAKHRDGITVPVAESIQAMPMDYGLFINDLKNRIRQERIKTVLTANAALVVMYWDIGSAILVKQKNEGWGSKVIDRMSHDLKEEFPDMNGFSSRNLKYMRAFAESWQKKEIVQAVLAQISWYHNLALIEKLKDSNLQLWYAQKAVENGWSRNVLVLQIE